MKKSLTLILIAVSILMVQCKKNKKSMSGKPEETTTSTEQVPADSKLVVNQLVIDPNFVQQDATDPFNIDSIYIHKDSLIVEVQYGGGCEVHEFSLKSNGAYLKSKPVQLNLALEHKANNDMCRALLYKRLAFDIKKTQGGGGNEVKLIVNNDRTKLVSYTY
jgi:hypothetical protein